MVKHVLSLGVVVVTQGFVFIPISRVGIAATAATVIAIAPYAATLDSFLVVACAGCIVGSAQHIGYAVGLAWWTLQTRCAHRPTFAKEVVVPVGVLAFLRELAVGFHAGKLRMFD